MIREREGRLWTQDEIEADNRRVAAKPVSEPLTPPKPEAPKARRQTKAEVIAGLMNRMSQHKPVAGDSVPAVLEDKPPFCERCGGQGRIKLYVPVGHPKHGQYIDCDAHECPALRYYRQRSAAVFYERMTRQFGKVIEYYDTAGIADLGNPQLRHNLVAVDAARRFIAGEPLNIDGVEKHSLVFCGLQGTGKTYLASIIRNELDRQGKLVWFNTVRTMLKAVQGGYDEDAAMSARAVENALCNAPFLFIDELEISRGSGDKIDILEAVINTRMLSKMPTVITTNLTQQKVGDVWNWRIQSRLVHIAWWIDMGKTGLRDRSGAIDGSGR